MLSLLLFLLLAIVTIPISSHAFFSHALKAAKTRLRSRGLVLSGGQPFKAEEGLVPDFCLAILGDLHLDRYDMALHNEGRQHIIDNMAVLKNKLSSPKSQARLVSLGDLGAYGDAGTTTCFEHAKAYLEGYHLPYNLVTGYVTRAALFFSSLSLTDLHLTPLHPFRNHDLEGMDEFSTDVENLQAWQDAFGLKFPTFCHQIGEKTLCIGLSTTRFRSSPFSSHEVYIPKAQTIWLENLLKHHPEEEGWRVLVFSHAPPMGAGIRVVQNVHIKNGCAFLNHSSGDEERRVFIRLCKENHCIKAWFSGHFHLSADYEDSITSREGTVFVQTGVMGEKSSRDGRRQSRMVQGDGEGLQVYTVNHHKGGELRLDVTIKYKPGGEDIVEAHGHEDYAHDKWFRAYSPAEEDGCYLQSPEGVILDAMDEEGEGREKVCWWHMADGRVLGVHEGQVIEYDAETLSPLGIVVDKEQLRGREMVVVGEGQALILVSSLEALSKETTEGDYEIIHPNEDGSYWRRRQRNKLVRQREKEREKIAADWLKQNFK